MQSLFLATEGWVAGLQILTSSLRDGADPSRLIGELGGRQRYLRDYLIEEVLARLDPPTLEFLERCSILEQLSADLCNAVTGRTDSREVLSAMDRQNLFVSPQDEEHRWFRLHHIFAEVLSARLQDDHAEELPVLHRKASEWFVAHNQPVEAINHRLASGDTDAAAELINVRAEWLMKQGELMVAKKWIGSLPEEICVRYPVIMFLRAWAGIENGRPLGRIERELDSIGGNRSVRGPGIVPAQLHRGTSRQRRAGSAAIREGQPNRSTNGTCLSMGMRSSGWQWHGSPRGRPVRGSTCWSRRPKNLCRPGACWWRRRLSPIRRGPWSNAARSTAESRRISEPLTLWSSPAAPAGGYVAWALIGLGEIDRLRGNIDGALELFREGMETLRELARSEHLLHEPRHRPCPAGQGPGSRCARRVTVR